MGRPVFSDLTGKRWKVIKWISFIIFLVIYSAILISILTFYFTEAVPSITDSVLSIWMTILAFYFFIAIFIGVFRLLLFMYFSLRHRLKQGVKADDEYMPKVSVIIPAYNEEVGIRRTVKSVLQSDYPIQEVIVVDDGSTDRTASIVKKRFRNSKRFKLITKKNGGKASALNIGFQIASGEIVVTVDADNILLKETISCLVAHFKDPRVGAVSGNCKIGKYTKQLPLWQHIEYVTANNLEKRALDYINCITVVPGSNGAWRKSVIEEVGFYEDDTMAEDTDITLKVICRNYRIVYEDRAITIEECPETVKDFIKQRVRWSYGILQSLWKNRRNIYTSENKALKYFAVPNMLITYIFHLTAPVVEIIFIIAIINGSFNVIFFFLLFFIIDSIASLYAFILGRENKKPLIWIFVQRIAYRYLFSYITWKALIIAIKGSGIGWQKLDRTGSHFK